MKTKLQKNKLPRLFPQGIKTADKIIMATAFLFAFFFMSHPDLWETANHTYIFLESLFSGKFMDFYRIVERHQNTYYYINPANYNIVVYIIFGLWELPVFLFNKIFGLALNERFIIYWAKAVSVAFFVGCGYQLKNLCAEMGMTEENAGTARLFFLFNPVAFYGPMQMGQYDTLCLFFTLWALVHYAKGDLKKFSLVMGVSIVCKFFPLLVFIPLLLLAEKKILNLVKYGIMAMWLYIPTTLLFFGRTGNASAFTKLMMERMFAITTDTPFGKMSVFLFAYAVLLFVCFVYCPQQETLKYMSAYIPMTVYGALMAVIVWHPQWVTLVIPFMVATTFMQKNKTVWFCLDLVLRAGFFMICYAFFGNQCGATLFTGGVLSHIFGINSGAGGHWQPLTRFLELVPYSYTVMPVMFSAPIFLNILLKMPVAGKTLADRISATEQFDKLPVKLWGYAIFAIGFGGMWLASSLLELINAYGII